MKQHCAAHISSIKEPIMRLLIANPKKWVASRAITAHLQTELGREVKPTCYMLRLIISGHVLRARKPEHLIRSKTAKPEFIYKWSGRPYRDKIQRLSQFPYDDLPPIDKAQIMRSLSAHHPDLPAWYRRMIL